MHRVLCAVLTAFVGLEIAAQAGSRLGTPPPPPPSSPVPRYERGKLWVSIADARLRPSGESSGSPVLDRIFVRYRVRSFKPAMPFARTPALRAVYEIVCDCNEAELQRVLSIEVPRLLTKIRRLEHPIALYDPIDYMWWGVPPDWLWHLRKIDAKSAWDVTRGRPDVKIAVIDNGFDAGHPDLVTKIVPAYDPYSGQLLTSNASQWHGTATASCAAGQTTETSSTATGQLASVGFNCGLLAYSWWSGLAKALHASTVMNADVISISWFSGCSPDTTGTDQAIIREILDNGTVIVASAGNGNQHCGGGGLFPFSATYDSRVIVVTSTDDNDLHGPTGHSHYPLVDLSSPGVNIMVATQTIGNSWPYYGGAGGTSFATPIVAGVAGLMRSVNGCLTPAEIESILKATADPVVDAASFPNGTGAGRVNAYRAVLGAGDQFTGFSIDGLTAQSISLCQSAPLRLNSCRTTCAQSGLAQSHCNSPNYFVSVQRSDAYWNRYGVEAMRWLTPAEAATICDFDLRAFVSGSGVTLDGGNYYRVKVAVGVTNAPWHEETHLVYLEPAVSEVTINGLAGPLVQIPTGTAAYLSMCASRCASSYSIVAQEIDSLGQPIGNPATVPQTAGMECYLDLTPLLTSINPPAPGRMYEIKLTVDAPPSLKTIRLKFN